MCRFIAILSILPIILFFMSPALAFSANLPITQDSLADLANQSRFFLNAAPLKTNKLLEQAAVLKAKDMAEKGYFSHIAPGGKTPWHWIIESGYSFDYAGENLAVNFADSKEVNSAWMKSPLHRANILNKNFAEIGIGLAEGEFYGKKAVYIVQIFAKPSQLIKR